MKARVLLFISFIFVFGLFGVCQAANIYWSGTGTSDWNTGTNWSTNNVPGSADKAVFQTTTGPEVTTSTPTIKNISLGVSGKGIVTLSGGSITTTAEVILGNGSSDNGTLTVNSGLFTIGTQLYVGNSGTGTVNMYDGNINVGQNFGIAEGVASSGTVNLYGGTITTAVFRMANGGGAASPKLNITGGILIITGDVSSNIQTYVNDGWITGYGSASNVHWNTTTNPGKTTVWATNSVKATIPNPANAATSIPLDASLSWTAGPGAASHNVYFGLTSPGVFWCNQTGTNFNPDGLAPDTTYYWRIDEVSDTNVVTTGDVWSFTTISASATDPIPADMATDISRNVILDWIAGPGAASHNIYFGTTSPGTFQGNQTGTTFNPGQLSLSAKYYWRIDEVSDTNIVTTGNVWSFTVSSGTAKNPDPANGATNVSFSKVLGWAAGLNDASHDVYFGTTLSDVNSASRIIGDLNGNGLVDWNDLALLGVYWLANPIGTEPFAAVNRDSTVDFTDYAMLSQDWMKHAGASFKGNQDSNNFNPGTLAFNTTYYWRIDEVNGPDTIRGNVWSFATQSGKAFNPSPANGSNATTDTTLSWSAGAGAISHNIYFGTTNPPASQGSQGGTAFNPGTLANSTTYYWRVDEVSGSGTITGDLWSFTTVGLNTTPVYPYLTWRGGPTNSVVVNWLNADVQGDSTVDYGTTSSYGSSVTVPTITNTHHVELTGLTSGQTYHYRIRSNDGTICSDSTYTVPVSSPTSFSFAVYGDPRGPSGGDPSVYYNRHQALCNWILAQNFDFAIQTGDSVWAGTTGLNVWWPDFFRLESNLSKSKVIMTTMGNHEVQGTNTGYYYYDLYTGAYPTNGTSGNSGRVYSFDYGNTHFVCLSSFQINEVTIQAPWLSADLAAARANPNIKWIFVYFHAPVYTTSGHPNDTTEQVPWCPIFDQYHVDIVFQGHNHVYERSKSIKGGLVVADGVGTVYMTCGLGGAPFDSTGVTGDSSLFASLYTSKTVAACVTVTGNQLTVNAITNVDNVVRDSFTLSK